MKIVIDGKLERRSKMKKRFLALALCSLLLHGNVPAEAAVPKLLTYQGILKDSSGSFLTGTYSMTFRIYSAVTGGSSLWSETQSSVSATSGRFSVILGSVTANSLTFNQDYWLSVQVGSDAEMSPRQRLTSAGYTLMAEDVTGGKLTGSAHAADSHMSIEGVRSAHANIAKTNFKLDAYSMASANSMGDLVVDSFNDSTGISSGSSSSYTWRGSPNYDVVATSNGGIDSNTVLMLHTNGTNGSTTFTDSSDNPLTVTANGNAQITTAQSKFGGASGTFDGSGDYLTIPSNSVFDFGTGDFTIDFWVRLASSSAGQCFIDRNETADFSVRFAGDGTLRFEIESSTVVSYSWSPSTNVWYHIAAVRSGSSCKLYIDGTQVGSTGTNSANATGTTQVAIGALASSLAHNLNGWIEELRISKGVARWTSNFTPPTSEYAGSSSAQGTVISTAYSESTAPKEAMVIADETLNTGSISYYVSRDNGTTWTSCPKETVTSISSQPSGTQLKWKAVINGNAELNAIAVAV